MSDGKGSVSRERFLEFVSQSQQHDLLFLALRDEAEIVGSPKAKAPKLRQESFIRRRDNFLVTSPRRKGSAREY